MTSNVSSRQPNFTLLSLIKQSFSLFNCIVLEDSRKQISLLNNVSKKKYRSSVWKTMWSVTIDRKAAKKWKFKVSVKCPCLLICIRHLTYRSDVYRSDGVTPFNWSLIHSVMNDHQDILCNMFPHIMVCFFPLLMLFRVKTILHQFVVFPHIDTFVSTEFSQYVLHGICD